MTRVSEAVRALPDVSRSRALFEEAERLMPGGTQLLSRRPSLFLPGAWPVYAERAKGCRIWDIDGNEYVDFLAGFGPFVLGYGCEAVDRAVIEQVRRTTCSTLNNPLEVEVAQILTEAVPCAEMVRFSKCGGEADAMAIRVARGYTGRDRVLFCGYHGWHDWYIAANLASAEALNAHLLPGVSPRGVPKGLAGTAIPFEYNNLDSLRGALEAHRGEVAAIIMEACRSKAPAPGYLEGVRRLATEHGAVLIFDEVVTGFRLARGGAQEYFGVTPDLTTFAKALGNGYPLSAVVGRRGVMEGAATQFISSLYWSDAIGLAAAKATLEEMRRVDAQRLLWERGRLLKEGLTEAIARRGVPAQCAGYEPMLSLAFEGGDAGLRKAMMSVYQQEMLRRGFLAGAGHPLSVAHTEEVIAGFVAAADEAFAEVRAGLDAGDLASRLETTGEQQEGFRRLV